MLEKEGGGSSEGAPGPAETALPGRPKGPTAATCRRSPLAAATEAMLASKTEDTRSMNKGDDDDECAPRKRSKGSKGNLSQWILQTKCADECRGNRGPNMHEHTTYTVAITKTPSGGPAHSAASCEVPWKRSHSLQLPSRPKASRTASVSVSAGYFTKGIYRGKYCKHASTYQKYHHKSCTYKKHGSYF